MPEHGTSRPSTGTGECWRGILTPNQKPMSSGHCSIRATQDINLDLDVTVTKCK